MKKHLIIILALCLIGTNAFAQDARLQKEGFYVVNDFSGMLNSHVSPYLIADGSAQQALNVRPNEVYGELVKRSLMNLLSTTPNAAIKSLFRYYKENDEKFTIATYSTNVGYYDANGTEIILWDSGTDSKRWSFITYKDLLIGMNGTDVAKKWDGETQVTADTDGSRTANDLMADLGAPFAELNTGSNLDASSWYQYKTAFTTGSVTYYSNSRSNPILTGASVQDISLTDIPLGIAGTTARYIYRTDGGVDRATVLADTDYKLVDTISDNTTRTLNDTTADGSSDTPTWTTTSGNIDVTVPKSRYCLINTERLFLGNDPSAEFQADGGKSTIYWSDILNPDFFNYAVDYDLIRPDDGDEITFLKNVKGILTIGKTRTINKFYTTASSSSNWKISDPYSESEGCVAPYSAVNVENGVAYLGRYGIYVFNGQISTLVSDNVTDKIRDILQTNLEEVAGIYHDNRYLITYTSQSTGAANNDRVLALDMVRNSYYVDTKSVDSFANFDSGDDFGTLYSGSSGTDGNIYAHDTSFSRLIYRFKSQLEGGTADSTFIGGVEDDPWITLGDDETWAESSTTWAASGLKTWAIGALTGYWTSPVVLVNATEYDQLYWNELLGASGDITFAVRSAGTTSDTLTASWSSEVSDPSGSDLSGETANTYVQLRSTLTSTSYTETPKLFLDDNFVIRMTYKKEGTTGESSVLSIWKGGKTNLGGGEYPKRIKEVQVFYKGTSGTLNVQFDNDQGDSYNFDVDLSVDPAADSTDTYFGTNAEKIYVHIPSFENVPTGRYWTFTLTEDGTTQWAVRRIVVRRDVNDYTTFK